ncbi:DNA binding domain-containing protein, excisionase family [Methylomagnum ishizawai]|uniref:DNA binding domain-containing protein, excisionase family n=1 Tax=Methylomagnum ishizawai TaxID=1760988 RepID=A0A1Y6CZF6_9GAMM|nr:response regulator [Methylomagnum ishizawai]SMF93692.1 DNA binding domain-containing protein, excisionase family [Methylomagnum ishizawai]
MSADNERNYLTPYEVAELLMVAPVTVRAWAQKGLLHSMTTPGGHRRFLRDEVERFARENGVNLESRQARGLRVLVVDDDRQFAGYLNEFLEGLPEPVAVAVANDGFEAGCKVHTFRPDVILLDLMMPDLDGFKVCRQIKQDPATAAIRVVAITGYPTPENFRRSLDEGAVHCLGKPVDTVELLSALGLPVVSG